MDRVSLQTVSYNFNFLIGYIYVEYPQFIVGLGSEEQVLFHRSQMFLFSVQHKPFGDLVDDPFHLWMIAGIPALHQLNKMIMISDSADRRNFCDTDNLQKVIKRFKLP